MTLSIFTRALCALALSTAAAGAHGTEDHGAGGHGQAAEAASAEYHLGDLTLAGPFAFATLPNSPVAGGFFTVTNAGSADDRLIAAASPVAGVMQVHEMVMDGDVMKMREMDGGLAIPAGQTVMLQPGGFHIMFMDLHGPLTAGESVPVTLTFEKAGSIDIDFPVVPREARTGMNQPGMNQPGMNQPGMGHDHGAMGQGGMGQGAGN